MCGIAGLHLKGTAHYERLGSLLAGMLERLGERGPDSAGAGVYSTAGLNRELHVDKVLGPPGNLTPLLAERPGYQGVGHTRMATESAVTVAHSHPFTVGDRMCLVHNGSFANHATIRRELVRDGEVFETDNDSEVAARFVARQLADGLVLEKALMRLCEVFDGFYTLLVTTPTEFAVVRDVIACKPALIAETDDWVAVASEYRALTVLPGIADAEVFEPAGEEVHLWSR